jgi:hypothetical protein
MQNPKKPSSAEKSNKVEDKIVIDNPEFRRNEIIMRTLKIKPIRAANIFGPAFIMFSFSPRYLTILFEVIAIRL